MHFIVLRDSTIVYRTSKALKLEFNPFGFENFLEECSLVGKVVYKNKSVNCSYAIDQFFLFCNVTFKIKGATCTEIDFLAGCAVFQKNGLRCVL